MEIKKKVFLLEINRILIISTMRVRLQPYAMDANSLETVILGPMDLELVPCSGGDDDPNEQESEGEDNGVVGEDGNGGNGGPINVPSGSSNSNDGGSETLISGSTASSQSGTVPESSGDEACEGVSRDDTRSLASVESSTGKCRSIEVKSRGSPSSSKNIHET